MTRLEELEANVAKAKEIADKAAATDLTCQTAMIGQTNRVNALDLGPERTPAFHIARYYANKATKERDRTADALDLAHVELNKEITR